MDLLIPDEWLRDFLKTKASAKEIAKHLSLCGPSVEKVQNSIDGPVYLIEVTTNRVDSASVYGIAREASAILPRFKIKTKLCPLTFKTKSVFVKKVNYLAAKVDPKICQRFSCVLIKNVTIKNSPEWMKKRLEAVGMRSLNNVVDISNYIMNELGQPVHTFDYDKIGRAKMFLRESKKGEQVTTLDGKTHNLSGGDIIIEDGDGRLIDLAGIMGAENSAVDNNTKNVLLFVQTYDPARIRKTSMRSAHRTQAAMLFEKGLDPELVSDGIKRGIDLFEELTGGRAEKEILDIYPQPYRAKKVKASLDFIFHRLGINLSPGEISQYLNSLGFATKRQKNNLEVTIPSFRANDINIPEDILEEVARIYGYFNLPSELMAGQLPEPLYNSPFEFEHQVKTLLSGWGAVEIYTLSLVSKEETIQGSLKLKNPLGRESEYLRTSLMPSLLTATTENSGTTEPFHLFEMSNVYLPVKGNLPIEKMTLAGIFANCDYRIAKGVIEAFLAKLHLEINWIVEDANNFLPARHLIIKENNTTLGQFGVLDNKNLIYYDFDVEALRKEYSPHESYKPIEKYPAQIEDMTLKFPAKTKIGQVISFIKEGEPKVSEVKLVDIYKNSFTLRLWYQNPRKTLTNEEVEGLRSKIVKELANRFGAVL